ncbi:MAG: GAF domain-containing protein [Oceanospirillaceae bacterium]|nr:GAF domain-containing protein [Oceanospirillaceae bacterium]
MHKLDNKDLLHRILAISRAIAGQLDCQSVLREIAGEVNKLFHFDHMDVAIMLADGVNSISYEVGLQTQWGELVTGARPIMLSPIRTLLQGEVPYLLTGDALADDRFHFDGAFDGPIFAAKLRSRVHVPLYVNGSLSGALNISSHLKHAYTEYDVEVAQCIADLLAPYFYALSQTEQAKKAALGESHARNSEKMLRLGALQLTQGMEQERKRLGMDLHDQTLADLTRLLRHVAVLRRADNALEAPFLSIEKELDTCINELRNIIEDTKPGVLELFGFAQGVEAQLERCVAGVKPDISIAVIDHSNDYLDQIDTSQRTTIYRIVQEAINNAVKHSAPTSVQVEISKATSSLRIAIIDNGEGLNIDPHNNVGGLDNMKVRAALVSSTLSFNKNPENSGTKVVLDIPYKAFNNLPASIK